MRQRINNLENAIYALAIKLLQLAEAHLDLVLPESDKDNQDKVVEFKAILLTHFCSFSWSSLLLTKGFDKNVVTAFQKLLQKKANAIVDKHKGNKKDWFENIKYQGDLLVKEKNVETDLSLGEDKLKQVKELLSKEVSKLDITVLENKARTIKYLKQIFPNPFWDHCINETVIPNLNAQQELIKDLKESMDILWDITVGYPVFWIYLLNSLPVLAFSMA